MLGKYVALERALPDWRSALFPRKHPALHSAFGLQSSRGHVSTWLSLIQKRSLRSSSAQFYLLAQTSSKISDLTDTQPFLCSQNLKDYVNLVSKSFPFCYSCAFPEHFANVKHFTEAFCLCHRSTPSKLTLSETVQVICWELLFTEDKQDVRPRSELRGSHHETLQFISELFYSCL